MRQFWITVRLRNGAEFAGAVNARSAAHARLIVRAEAARTDIETITAEEV